MPNVQLLPHFELEYVQYLGRGMCFEQPLCMLKIKMRTRMILEPLWKNFKGPVGIKGLVKHKILYRARHVPNKALKLVRLFDLIMSLGLLHLRLSIFIHIYVVDTCLHPWRRSDQLGVLQ